MAPRWTSCGTGRTGNARAWRPSRGRHADERADRSAAAGDGPGRHGTEGAGTAVPVRGRRGAGRLGHPLPQGRGHGGPAARPGRAAGVGPAGRGGGGVHGRVRARVVGRARG
ncbi:hypothetical protein SGPA1_31231 [Streptomyces misionensis JCM 4497]